MAEAFKQASELIEKSQYEYAIYLLSVCISTQYETNESLCRRATCYMYMNRYKEAIDDLEKAIALDRSNPKAYVKQSKCYVAIGDLNNAINMLNFLCQFEEYIDYAKLQITTLKNIKDLDKRAEKLYEQDKYKDVIRIMDECLEKAATCYKFKLKKAECLVFLGEHEQALVDVNEVLFTYKDDTDAVCIRAMNLLHQEKYRLGMAELREVFSLSTKAAEMYRNYKEITETIKKASAEFTNNNLDNAKHLYLKSLTKDVRNRRKNKYVLLKLALIYFKQDDYDNCIETTCRILELDNNNITALKYRAECNLKLEEYELAQEDYKALTSIENNDENEKQLQEIEKKLKIQNDYYKILEISKETTSAAEITKAYRKLAKIYHPDKATDTLSYTTHKFNIKFSKINTAYQELLKIHT